MDLEKAKGLKDKIGVSLKLVNNYEEENKFEEYFNTANDLIEYII